VAAGGGASEAAKEAVQLQLQLLQY